MGSGHGAGWETGLLWVTPGGGEDGPSSQSSHYRDCGQAHPAGHADAHLLLRLSPHAHPGFELFQQAPALSSAEFSGS